MIKQSETPVDEKRERFDIVFHFPSTGVFACFNFLFETHVNFCEKLYNFRTESKNNYSPFRVYNATAILAGRRAN